jgi:NTP pyrophosphatase (non-canonical NTP hydrolase)
MSAEQFQQLTVADYVVQALRTDRGTEGKSLAFPLLGLFGETGSLLSEVKKKQRDKVSFVAYAANVAEELGDVLWYLTVLANRGGVSLTDVATNVGRNYTNWKPVGDATIDFASLQPEHIDLTGEPTPKFENTLLKLAGDVGQLAMDFQSGALTDNQAALTGRLVTVLRSLIDTATDAGMSLEGAAVKNLWKTADRWSETQVYPPPLDANAIPEEWLPRTMVIEIIEREVRGKKYVFQTWNGVHIGDRLTDNAEEPDDYRFHDVFHYAYAAVLTWSPVLRSLLRLKRKSDPIADEAQDGARAILIEEGITTWIFGLAEDHQYFVDKKAGELPFDLLKDIRQFVKGYEAKICPLWMWEEAILQGYAAFRFLREHRRGRVEIDMLNHRLNFEALP